MTSSDFTFFGKQVPPPPTDKRFFDGEQTDPVTVFSGQTSQIYTSGGIEFQTPGGKTLSGSEYLSFTGQTGFDDNWKCSGTTGILKFAIDLAAPVEVCAHIRYCEEVGGTDEGTSAAVYLTGSGEGATQTQALAWRMNTEQSGWTWVQSGDFTLPAGPTTVQFNVAVADDNDFYIENFDLLTAPFSSTPPMSNIRSD